MLCENLLGDPIVARWFNLLCGFISLLVRFSVLVSEVCIL